MAENKDVDKQIDVVEGTITQDEADQPAYERVYQVYDNSRIPVSKYVGKLWHNRWKDASKLLEKSGAKDRWKEAIAYYQNDQGAMANKRNRLSELGTGKSNDARFLSENIVYANTSALVPATYAKNPDVEITSDNSAHEDRAKLYERLVDTLFNRKQSPGINLKPKMKKAVVTTTLTNISYVELAYIKKEDGSEQAIQEIESLSKELEEAKDMNTIKEVEGKLQALEEKVALLSSSGPVVKFRPPEMVIVDPNSPNGDPIEGDYIFIGEYIRTDYLRAVYGRKNDKGEFMSIFKPTHILEGDKDSQGHNDDINHFTLLDSGAEHEQYGFKDKKDFEQSCRTLCWYLWDKTTRRVYLFNDSDWSWPIWVWDDPYKLSRFYPIFALTFTTDPQDMFARSEVMYYLDQQDEINQINNERARMRHWVMSKVFVNTNVLKDATKIQKFLTDDASNLVHGIDLPEGVRISDAIGAFPAPSTAFEGLFDTRPIMESINRLSSVTPTLQNAQYKTNTTNRAIESYESSTQMRLDEKIDAIEEMLADLGRALLEMCVQFMPASDLDMLFGGEYVKAHGGWAEGMTTEQFNQEFSMRIIGGSTLKPTSKVKKEQAMGLGQVLGQFANASPMVIIVMLKMLERAYGDDVVITPEEWKAIIEATMQQMQRGGPGQGTEGGQPQPPQPQQEGQQQGGGDINEIMSQVESVIEQLPSEAKQFLGAGIAKGVPLKQLVQQLTQAAQGSQQRPQ